jgi:co-chaperonin GroES (HSP10)
VKRIKEEDKTKGGSSFPIPPRKNRKEGEVVAVGKVKMTDAGKLARERHLRCAGCVRECDADYEDYETL